MAIGFEEVGSLTLKILIFSIVYHYASKRFYPHLLRKYKQRGKALPESIQVKIKD